MVPADYKTYVDNISEDLERLEKMTKQTQE